MAWRDLFRWGQKSASAYDILRELSASSRSKTGKVVNTDTALTVSTAFACLRLIGYGMAVPPLKLMRRAPDGKSRQPATDHPLYSLLAAKPNDWQTAFEFIETVSWHVELCLAAYVFVNRSVTGEVLELFALEPSAMTVKQNDDRSITYTFRGKSGVERIIPSSNILHLRGPSWNGWQGLEFLKAAREAFGLSMATEDSQASLHKNGVRTSGAYSVEDKLNATQLADLYAWIKKEHTGPDVSGLPMVLDRGAKWVQTQMSGVDAQHLETRKHQIEEVCRYFGVLPIMVGYSDKASTYASAEVQHLAHLMHTLAPRWKRFEQSLDANLLTEDERAEGLYFDFVEEGMIRGSVKDTKDAILGYVNGGIITPNEGRALLDLNPDSDPASNKLRIPVNTAQEPKKPDDDDPSPVAA